MTPSAPTSDYNNDKFYIQTASESRRQVGFDSQKSDKFISILFN